MKDSNLYKNTKSKIHEFVQEKSLLNNHDISEIIYIWSIRIWIYNLLNLKDPKLNLKKFLNQYHLTESVMYIDELMRYISFSKKQRLDFKNLQCIYLGDGEKKLLKSIKFTQNNLNRQNNLNDFMDESYIVDFNRCLKEIAIIYAKNGYFFSNKQSY